MGVGLAVVEASHTVDGRNLAPPKTERLEFEGLHVLRAVLDFLHSQYEDVFKVAQQ